VKSIADRLSPEIARQIHPDRRQNEESYWTVRGQRLDQYRGQWIGFADGKVIASVRSPVAGFHAVEATGQHPLFICVGRQEEPCRVRRVSFAFDVRDPGEAAPLIDVEFRQAGGRPGSNHFRYGSRCGRPAMRGLSTPATGSGHSLDATG